MVDRPSLPRMNLGRLVLVCLAMGGGVASAEMPAPLWIDFNSTNQDGGPHPQAGYQSYDARHEVAEDFAAARACAAFDTTVSLSVAFPDTSDARVEQMIDRTADYDGNWQGQKPALLTDWIGVDTRIANGGNGTYDGTTGTPTRITFTLAGIPAGTYQWRSYHHDTENVHCRFLVECSTDGGGQFGAIAGPEAGGAFRMTDSTPGGTPASPQVYQGTGGQDPATLPSTVSFPFAATAGQAVVLRFTPLSSADGVHVQLFGVNGFEIELMGSPDGPSALALSHDRLSHTALVGTAVGVLTTTDPTPGDTFTYTLVAGTGSDDNAEFEVSGDQLVTARDLSGRPVGDVLGVRVRTTDAAGNYFEQPLTVQLVADADGDGLEDQWELTWFPDLASADAAGDPDGDLLTNLQEQGAGTDPTRADTDGDGLADHLENDSRVFLGPGDPGSSPLLADTDGDGLGDGAEVSGAGGHITNPNLTDSDGDQFSDPVEIAAGTDPNDPDDRPATPLPLVLSEILARNDNGLEDGFGERHDWIEIHNPNPVPLDLAGYCLTDDPLQPARWRFPAVTIPAGGWLLVFASGLDTVDPLGHPHTNFQLNGDGEYLALLRPDGGTVDDAYAPVFPAQFTDLTYGRVTGAGSGFFAVPTPGAANGAAYPGVVNDTRFDHDRGFYSEPFTVAITCATAGATIRYTTDGSAPSPTSGLVYTGPVPVTGTTTLRAIAYRTGWLPTNVDTQTYLFVGQAAQQPAAPAGWPTDWGYDSEVGAIVPADYEMDPRVVNGTLPGYDVPTALLDIPSVALALDPDGFISDASGIWANPLARWERPCSIEYLRPDGVAGFQHDAKVEVHGNSSRRPWRMQKHSLRVTFTTAVGGPPKLRYPLFPDSPVDRFNKLVLRACFSDSWGLVSWDTARYRPNDSQYLRDVWMKESLRALGHPSSCGNFVHLYVNGLYFGLFNLTERLEDDFFAEHLGGAPEDWEINEDFSSPGARWNAMMAVDPSTAEGYAQIQQYLDLGNFADYMLLHLYADAEDWPHHNGYAAANAASGDGRFRFFVWDQEIVLDYHGRAAQRIDRTGGVGTLFQKLRANPEFRLLFADRVRRHCFDGGALSLAGSQARYLAIAAMIDKAIVAESARWGDVAASTPYGNPVEQPDPVDDYDHLHYPPAPNYPDQAAIYFTREANWAVERDNVVDHYLPAIHDTNNSYALLNLLRSRSLYPTLEAPAFGLPGGLVPAGYQLAIGAAAGTVHFTLDGSDPRLPGGAVNPAAGALAAPGGSITLDETATVAARVFDGAEWSALTSALFTVGVAPSPANLVVSEIMYHPPDPDADAEFIELMNIDPAAPVDLGGVAFTAGISYTFPAGTVLPPGARIVVARDRDLFAAFHPAAAAALAPGAFTGNLSNSGETITLAGPDAQVLRSFAYGDAPPWPPSPDGAGDSLVLIAPASNPDHALPASWRPSASRLGNPGTTDATTFAGDPAADLDHDGRPALLEYATGGADDTPADGPALVAAILTVDGGAGPAVYLTVSHRRNLAADDVVIEAQLSTDLAEWSTLDTVLLAETTNGDGTTTVTWRSAHPLASRPREFLRLAVHPR